MTEKGNSKTAPGEILELFKGGYLSVAETIAALDDLIPSNVQAPMDQTNHHNALKCPYCNPDGMVLMPREATRAMTMAGCDSLPACEHVFGYAGEILRNAYRKMVEVGSLVPSTDEKSPVLNWKLDRPECPRCRGHGRVDIMACNDCGATGVVVSSTSQGGDK